MKAYIIRIVGAAIIAAFSEYLVPKGWQKYMKLISGLIIISVLIMPFYGGESVDIFDGFTIEEYEEEGKDIMVKKVKEQLEKDISEDIAVRVFEEFSENIKAQTEVRLNSEGKIERVEKIKIFGREDEEIEERLKFVYGVDEVIWN